jgi:hypothetical protein
MKTRKNKTITMLVLRGLIPVIVICLLNSCDGNLDLDFSDLSIPTIDLPIIQIDEAPQLISPEDGAILDNGRTDRLDNVIWDFDWSEVTNATLYHIYVIHQGAQYPVIDCLVYESSYHHESISSYIINENRFDWRWKVRGCRVDNSGSYVYGPWSEERTFDAEPVNTDPPSN